MILSPRERKIKGIKEIKGIIKLKLHYTLRNIKNRFLSSKAVKKIKIIVLSTYFRVLTL